MIPGDLVRFIKWNDVDPEDWNLGERNCIGILIKYDKLMKKADILYEGELLEIRAQLVEKAGKKDGGDQ